MCLNLLSCVSTRRNGSATLLGIILGVSMLLGCASNSEEVEMVSTPVSDWQRRGETFLYEGRSVFTIDEGEGFPVIILHGYPGSSWDFHKVWPAITEHNRAIAPDFLGYGLSDKPQDYSYSVADHAAMVTELATSKGIKEVKLVAHDVGVLVALELIIKAPESGLKIESVALLNGTLFSSERHPKFIQRLLGGPLGGLVNRAASERTFTTNLLAISGEAGEDLRPTFKTQWQLLNHPYNARLMHKLLHTVRDRRENELRWADALCTSDVPLTFIVGGADPTSGTRMPESLSDYCRKSFSVSVLADVGHFPQLEAPQQTSEALREWWNGGY